MKNKSLQEIVLIVISKIRMFWGNYNYLLAYWWKVNIKSGAKFDGKIHFQKSSNTQICIGKNCTFRSRHTSNNIGVNRPCMITTMPSPFKAKITIGNNCGFSGTVIGAFKSIVLGDNVRCGANTLITDSDWHLDDPRSANPASVTIEDNVWLGVNSIVMKGVTIGKNSVIGANSVVTKNIPANVIAAGNPCIVIKPIK